MSDVTFSEINDYKVVLYGEGESSHIGAFIHCYKNGDNVMSCTFFNDEDNVPMNSQGPRVDLRYPMSKFTETLDVLRNEEPVFFGYIDSTKLGYITTNAEPIGEEEAR